jgi:hypothetical protein
MAMPAAITIITAAATQAGTFSKGQAKTRITIATSANRTVGGLLAKNHGAFRSPSPGVKHFYREKRLG